MSDTAKIKSKGRLRSNIILFLAGKFVSLFGSFVYSFAIGLFVLKETGSGLSFATTLLLSSLPRILLGPIAGVIADKVNRKTMVVVMDFLSGLVVLGLLLAFNLDAFRMQYIYLASVLLSICNTFFGVAMEASIPNFVDDSYLMRINSMSSGISSATNIIAPIIGGMIYGLVSINFFLLVNGIAFVLSGISEMFIDFKYNLGGEGACAGEKGRFFKNLKEGFMYLRGQELLIVLFASALVINFLFSLGFNVPFPYLVNNIIGLSPAQYGTISGFFPVGVLLGSLILSLLPEREKKFHYLFYGIFIMSLAIILFGLPGLPSVLNLLSQNAIFIYMLSVAFLVGFVNPFVNTPVAVMLQRSTPDYLRGRVFGLINTLSMSITPVAYILSGLLLDRVPTFILIVVPGILAVLFTIRIGTNKVLKSF